MKKIKLTIPKNNKESIGYIIDSLKKIHKTENHGFAPEEVERLLKIENDFISNFDSSLKKIDEINSIVNNGIKAFREICKIIAEPDFQSLIRVSEIGWYVSPNIIRDFSISHLNEILEENNLSKLEFFFLKNSTNLAHEIINKAIEAFPKRIDIFTEILRCFNNELYSATICLAYSQADGICNEIWGFGFFDKTGSPDYKLKSYIEFKEYKKGFASIFSEQLKIKENEITMYSKDFKNEFPNKVSESFNRHLIAHGHSINYGNRINAMRAILLIDFLLFFNDIKRKTSL